MAAPEAKLLGVTPPLSTTLPTESERKASDSLVMELKRQNNYENDSETSKRQAVLNQLQRITEEFVKQVTRSQGKPDHVVQAAGGRVVTFGSYKLGVIGPGSDIDTLVVAPENITKDDFFATFPELLVKMAPEGAIDELTSKPDAFAPCITLKFSGIDIDLLFGRVKKNMVTKALEEQLTDQTLLQGLNDQEVRTLNGVRVADEMLKLVPERSIFRTALRTIKLWSTRRAIAGNMYGFPGGVAWAILVARVCQLYPRATASTIVTKFFKILEQWRWPQPILLKAIESGKLNLKVWNPKLYHGDGKHLMPIITPAYPSMCTTHNVTRSTMEVIKRELKHGGNITDQIIMGKAQWKDLFTKHTFFTAGYKYYLCVITSSTTKEAQQIWSGFVESKLRLLVGRLENHQSINIAHPFNKGFNRAHRCPSEDQVNAVKAGSLEYYAEDIGTVTTGHGLAVGNSNSDGIVDGERKMDQGSITMVYTTTNYIGLELYEGAKSLDLSREVGEFKENCRAWDSYNEEFSAIHIDHIKNYDLPSDVFGEGEVKPTKKKTPNGTRKRTASEESKRPTAKRARSSVAAAG